MSLLNGIGALGAGLGAFAANAAKDAEAAPERKPLLNSTPAAPVESTPAVAAPAPAPTEATGAPDAKSEMTTVSAPGGAKFTVASAVADKFQGLLVDLDKAGYPIDAAHSAGYRPLAPGETHETNPHAGGHAIDINANRNPMGSGQPTDIPPDLARQLAAKWGMQWGGDFRTTPRDPMHFQVKAT